MLSLKLVVSKQMMAPGASYITKGPDGRRESRDRDIKKEKGPDDVAAAVPCRHRQDSGFQAGPDLSQCTMRAGGNGPVASRNPQTPSPVAVEQGCAAILLRPWLSVLGRRVVIGPGGLSAVLYWICTEGSGLASGLCCVDARIPSKGSGPLVQRSRPTKLSM